MTNNKTREQARKEAADFIDEIRIGVQQRGPMAFDFSQYISVFDEVKKCGTICCMAGWVPAIRPDLAKWYYRFDSEEWVVATLVGTYFVPALVGIPIGRLLWSALTIPGYQVDISECVLYGTASLRQVCDLWQRVSDRIRKGDLDDHLIYDNDPDLLPF